MNAYEYLKNRGYMADPKELAKILGVQYRINNKISTSLLIGAGLWFMSLIFLFSPKISWAGIGFIMMPLTLVTAIFFIGKNQKIEQHFRYKFYDEFRENKDLLKDLIEDLMRQSVSDWDRYADKTYYLPIIESVDNKKKFNKELDLVLTRYWKDREEMEKKRVSLNSFFGKETDSIRNISDIIDGAQEDTQTVKSRDASTNIVQGHMKSAK